MSIFADIAENRIQEAIDHGEFDSLQGKGKPLDLEAYYASPASLRAGFALLKSANAVPPEVEAMREVQRMRQEIETISATGADMNPELLQQLHFELQLRQTELNMALERMRRTFRQDLSAR